MTHEQKIMRAHAEVTAAQMKMLNTRTDTERRVAERAYRIALQKLAEAEMSK